MDNNGIGDAKLLLRQEALKRTKACMEELLSTINNILNRHGCAIVHQGQLKSGVWVPVEDLGFLQGRIQVGNRQE